MKDIASNRRSAALISSILVLPFGILQFLFNPVETQNGLDLIVLFGLMWLLPFSFIVMVKRMVRTAKAGTPITARPMYLFLSVACLALLATAWVSLVMDQLPCFLGVPNCD